MGNQQNSFREWSQSVDSEAPSPVQEGIPIQTQVGDEIRRERLKKIPKYANHPAYIASLYSVSNIVKP